MPKCDHCLIEIPERSAIVDAINGKQKIFCCDGCRGVYRLINEEGLDEFYLRRESSWIPGPPKDREIEPAAFKETIREEGNSAEVEIILDGIRCASCIWLIEKMITKMKGVTYARANYATHRVKIRWKPAVIDIRDILVRIKSIGYTPKPVVLGASEEQAKKEQRDLLIRFGTAAFFSMQLMMYSVALYAGYFQGISDTVKSVLQVVSLSLATPVVFYSGMPFIKGAARGLKNRSFNMDVLIITGAGSAYIYSIYQIFIGGEVYFDTSAMIITLILLGRYIESGAKGRASDVITRLLSLNPREARIVKNSGSGAVSELVPISSIKKGDIVQIQPGERIPLDGTVTEGFSEVDESMLTGESRLVSKRSGSEVFCGTQNRYGSFNFRVTRVGKETVLSQIIKAVEDAQARQAPVQALADRVVGFFVPAVLTLSIATGIFWMYKSNLFTAAVMNAISVLVIACPCALGLATPLAVLIGTTKGASKGILIKGGDVIEKTKDIDTVVLDKTGTITEGKPQLTLYRGIDIPDAEALRIASSIERHSEHSIAKAIVKADEAGESYEVSHFNAYPGKGVMGEVNGKTTLIGSRRFIESEGISGIIDNTVGNELLSQIRSWESSGSTVVYLSYDKRLAGVFVISDPVRNEAAETISMLKNMGHDVIMTTGDEKATALTVGRIIGLNEEKILANRLPVEKSDIIEAMQRAGKHVMMVGDGINDAPALVQADVGIAMGRATDIALESSDMVLMRSDLRLVPRAAKLTKKIYSTIKQNLFWAFLYNIVALPLAMAGVLHPITAAISMTLSSLSVLGNSLRLKKA